MNEHKKINQSIEELLDEWITDPINQSIDTDAVKETYQKKNQ